MKITKKNSTSLVVLSAILFLNMYQPMSIDAKPMAYIANQGDDTVSVIDTATNSVGATIPVGDGPFGVAVHPNGSTAYVTNEYDYTVSIIDAATNSVTDTIEIGNRVTCIAVTPDGSSLYVGCDAYPDSYIAVINTTSKTITNTINGEWMSIPMGISFTSDGKTAYVGDIEGWATVIDTASSTVIDEIQSGWTSGVVVHPDGTKVYIAWHLDEIYVVDIATNDIVDEIFLPDGVNNIAVHPDGNRLYAVGGIGLYTIDLTTNTIISEIPCGSGYGLGISGIAITPDGNRVYVTHSEDNIVIVIDTTLNIVVDTIAVGLNPIAYGSFIGPESAISIDDIMDFWRQSIVAHDVRGAGSNASIAVRNRIDFYNLLASANSYISKGRYKKARSFLYNAYQQCDGKGDPPDLIIGKAASSLNIMILQLIRELKSYLPPVSG